jgi:serine/threonine-protein kinase
MTGVATKVRVRQFGPYVLGRRIGSGGMATVFAARQFGARGATRVVAVKVMATALADDPTAQQMFEREAVIATRIEHPNIVRTYEVGEVSGEIFLAMELVQGATLSTLCARSPGGSPVPVAVRIACDVARGLHAVHELRDASDELLGVVHQDVTPHNVIVDYDGSTKLLDFGVARMVSRDGSRTEHVRGKPPYLAPEQVLLERIDRRADIYALGAVMYELLTGARSSGPSGAPATERTSANDVRALRPEVPEAVARVVARALEVDPDRRFSTADEMRRALTEAREESGVEAVDEGVVAAWARAVAPPAWSLGDLERELSTEELYRAEVAAVADLPTVSDPPLSPYTGWKTVRRRRRTGALLLLLPLALIGAGVGGWRLAKRSARAPSPPSPVEGVATRSDTSPELAPPPVASGTSQAPEPALPAASGRPSSAERRSSGRASGAHSVAPAMSSAAEAPTPTFLSVWSSPWGHVSVDGVAVGDSPVARLPTAPGSHVVRITTAAGAAQERVVPVKAGEDRTERFVF